MPESAAPQAVLEALADKGTTPPPGHVFSLYLPFWRKSDWRKAGDNAKREALEAVCKARSQLAKELRDRQSKLAEKRDAQTIEAVSISPFVTGMGEEHAVENGFAFLSPYGLPYLAGSGVKGVIRRAAEELAQAGEGGWTFARVAWLFGYEENDYVTALDKDLGQGDDEAKELLQRLTNKKVDSFGGVADSDKHLAGALSFWDVIIDGKLGVDILTPHYGHYYQGEQSPHDSGQPQPNPFLVVAPGATFTFHITCTERRLPKSLRGDTWRDLIKAAFDHAFEWGGFGAKTAVGYGVLETTAQKEARIAEERKAEILRKKQEEIREKNWKPEPNMRMDWPDAGEEVTIIAIEGNKARVRFDDGEEDVVELSDLRRIDQ